MPNSAKKTLTDAGYIAIGLGVMGFQQAQVRARAACDHVNGVGSRVAGQAREVRSSVDAQTRTARTQAEAQARSTVARANAQASAVRDEVGKRVEHVVGSVQAQLNDLPERIVQAMEPIAARVRGAAGNAA